MIIKPEDFTSAYRRIIFKTLSLLKNSYPAMAESCEEKEKKIKDAPEIFQMATQILLKSLTFFYANVVIIDKITATTKRILIPYKDTVKNYKGTKDAGRFLVDFNIEELPDKKPYPEEIISINKKGVINGYIHPHVQSGTKKACWGNMRETLTHLMLEAELLGALLCIPPFLSKVNLDSCYAVADFYKLKEAAEAQQESDVSER